MKEPMVHKRNKKEKTSSLCFYIVGEDFTNLVRSIWADEREPERALDILEAGFPDMAEAERYAILCGDKKLVGDSRDGLKLLPDGVKRSKHGNPLHVKGIIARETQKVDRLMDEVQVASGQVDYVTSRKGLVGIPNRKREAWRQGKVTLETVPYKISSVSTTLRDLRITEQERRELENGGPFVEKCEPPKSDHYISNEDGWLSSDGKFYRCGPMQHTALSDALGKTSRQLERLGWIKLSAGRVFAPEKQATQAQINLLYAWCQQEGKQLPSWLECLLEEK